MRTRMLAAVLLLAVAIVPGAQADGGPSVKENAGLSGIATPTGFRYLVVDSPTVSVLVRTAPSGRVVAEKYLPGRFTIQGVAYDGSPTGLSADGKTLVLVRPRDAFPRRQTRFLVLATPGLYIRQDVVLDGDFNLDAISPDGSLLYFIHYLSRRDPGRYEVRVFDRGAGRLVPEPVVDRSEPDEEMRGLPISRAMSPDGRWAYTLYDGAGKAPFVHALDTVGTAAHCIDLDSLAGRKDLANLRLGLERDGELAVFSKGQPLLLVDTRSFRVSEPGRSSSSADGAPWTPIGGGAALLLAAGAASLLYVRRRRFAPS
jgi:hypothetical protein